MVDWSAIDVGAIGANAHHNGDESKEQLSHGVRGERLADMQVRAVHRGGVRGDAGAVRAEGACARG
jgi:hypothetical protein